MNPITRSEMFLNAAAGNEQALPTPITREEVFLKAVVDAQSGGGGGSGGGGVLVVHLDNDTGELDKTWQEIHDAPFPVMYGAGDEYSVHLPIITTEIDRSEYRVFILMRDGEVLGLLPAVTDSANGYPVVHED